MLTKPMCDETITIARMGLIAADHVKPVFFRTHSKCVRAVDARFHTQI